jgi:hypothetical protein
MNPNPSLPAAPGPTFNLGRALASLATQPHTFILKNSVKPNFELRLTFEPQGQVQRSGHRLATYKKTMMTVRDGQAQPAISSETTVDLTSRAFVSLKVGEHVFTQKMPIALPEHARVGDRGRCFEMPTTVTWSLAAAPNGLATWALHIQPQGGQGMETDECYHLNEAGDIVGAVMRTWATQYGAAERAGATPQRKMVEFATG